MGRIHKHHSGKTKLEAAIGMISGKYPVAELALKYGVHPCQLHRWKAELLEKGVDVFGRRRKKTDDHPSVDDLQRKIGELTMDLDYLKKALGK